MALRLKTSLSLKTKVLIVVVVVLFLYIAIGTFISSSIFADEYSNALKSESLVVGHSLELQLNKLLKLGIPLEEITGFEEQCQETVEKYEDISYTMIVDLNGEILFHSDPSQQGKTINDEEILNAVRNGKETVQIFSMAEEYYDTSVPIFDTNGQHIGAIRIGFPTEIINQKIGAIILSSIIGALVSFIITAFILVHLLSIWVTKPLNKLLTVIKNIRERGDLSMKTESISYDEIGQLASSFNQMTADLKESRDQLIESQKNLEEKVEERTKELADSKRRIELQNIELKKLNQIKSEFLNVTSHELRTPITGIKGYVQMMLKQSLGDVTETQKNALEVVLRNTDRLDHLVQDILDISQLQSRTMKFKPKQTDVGELVEETVETMQPSADSKEIKINLEVEDNLPALIIDQDRVKQVMMNLVNNAIKFSPYGSSVNVRAKNNRDNVLFEVQDSGCGIPKDEHKKVFEPFYQVDSGMDRKSSGVGLGLSLSRGVIVSHGGKIWVESKEDRGSKFSFTLPFKPVEDVEGRFREAYYYPEISSS